MQDYSNVKVGDKVWYLNTINTRRQTSTPATVTKVGRKLITVMTTYKTEVVFRKETGRSNDNYGHDMLIVDMEAYEAEIKPNKAYNTLRHGLGWSPKAGVTYADIVEAAKLLKLDLKEEESEKA